jgi:imidazolonepropionase-like amidohydrolase
MNLDSIRIGNRNPGWKVQGRTESLRVEQDIGRLDKGPAADIVFIEDNPLEDLAALKDIAMTVRQGEIVFEREMPKK